MRLVVGADILPSAHKWREIERVRALAPFFVVGRAGFESVSDAHAELIQVSSTEMRQKLAAAEDVTSWMSSSVRAYIAEHGLYGA
jgi:nicotinic acid mononucleotide adenylyltransferase